MFNVYVLTYVHISLIALELPTNIYFSIETFRKKAMNKNTLRKKLNKALKTLETMVKSKPAKKTRKCHYVSNTGFLPMYVINLIQTPALHADGGNLSSSGIIGTLS